MAKGIDFPESNVALGPPEGMTEEEVYTLPIRRVRLPDGSIECTSKWKLSESELEEVKRTGCIWLSVVGTTHPPLHIGAVYPYIEAPETFRKAVEDTWKNDVLSNRPLGSGI